MTAKTKWLFHSWKTLLPYISLDLGVARNTSSAFNMSPLIFEALPIAGFQSHKTVAFTYSLGAGLHKILSPHWQIGVGYLFNDFGKSYLGPAPSQTTPHGLQLKNLYIHELEWTLNYRF